jgi:hypothetical protein
VHSDELDDGEEEGLKKVLANTTDLSVQAVKAQLQEPLRYSVALQAYSVSWNGVYLSASCARVLRA